MTALRLLKKYGQTITVDQISTGSYNPLSGTQTTTKTSSTAIGALFNHKAKDVDESLIMSGDKRLIMDSSINIKTDDLVLAGGIIYTVVAVSELKPSDTRILWICNLRSLS
jgi:hypothetical protein